MTNPRDTIWGNSSETGWCLRATLLGPRRSGAAVPRLSPDRAGAPKIYRAREARRWRAAPTGKESDHSGGLLSGCSTPGPITALGWGLASGRQHSCGSREIRGSFGECGYEFSTPAWARTEWTN